MKTIDLFKKETVLSFEIFPPKPNSPIDTIYKTLDGMKNLKPDFISVTYGASGGNNSKRTFQIASDIKRNYEIESVAHLSCIGFNKNNVKQKLEELRVLDIENILVLRGDAIDENSTASDFKYASDLISFIKEQGNFNILAACYPEGHNESKNLVEDIHNLKRKVDAGVNHLVTQFFFDNDYFYSFIERCQYVDIHVPVEAGIMPVVNKKQIKRMVSLGGVTLPNKFITMMDKYENNPVALQDAGIAFAIDQIVDLVAQGVDGIHLYTMNNSYVANRIYEAIQHIIKFDPQKNVINSNY